MIKTKLNAKRTSSAVQILHDRISEDSQMHDLLVEARLNAKIARLIYEARTEAGLTQAQLAKRIGTKQPVISMLEDAEYEGHSLTMLQRIATALNQRLDVEFSPVKRKAHAAAG